MTAFDQAEGIRYLTRLLRSGLVTMMELKNVNKPVFTAVANGWAEDRVTLFSENPDNIYLMASLSSRFAYRLTIKRNSVAYLGLCTQQGSFGGEGNLDTVDEKEFQDMSAESEFTVLLAAKNIDKSEHFLKLNPFYDKANIVARNNFKDRDAETASVLSIEKIGEFEYDEETKTLGDYKQVTKNESKHADVNDSFTENDMLTCDHVLEALDGTGKMVAGASMVFAKWAYDFQKNLNNFQLIDPTRAKIGGDPNVHYYYNYWKIEKDECIVVTATIPECYNWNLQVNNHWLESLDYRYYRVHVNMTNANYRKDNSVVVVVCRENPKSYIEEDECDNYNWLTTTGHLQGVLTWRWIKARGEVIPSPTCTVHKLVDLNKYLKN